MKVCLAGSGGGHLNQLKQLESIYSKHKYYFVTHKTALSKSLAETNKVYFVDDVAFGSLKKNIRRWWALILNLFKSFRIILKEKPDVVISTGAGSVLWTCYLAKLCRKKLIYIESIASVYTPSLFGRFVSPLADMVIVQWKSLLEHYRKAEYGGPIFNFFKANGHKTNRSSDKILVTVGTHDKFDRLLNEVNRLVENGIIKEKVIAQIGPSGFSSKSVEAFKGCSSDEMDRYLNECKTVVTHGGSGSIINALLKGCTVIAVPRKKEFGEHYDDYQIEFVKALEAKGSILGVYELENLRKVLGMSKTFEPKIFKEGSKIVPLIERFLKRVSSKN